MTNESRLALLAERLPEWYGRNHRELPWRNEPSPYRVWISEIMLQQTRIEAVKGYFDRFVSALPDVRSLAESEEDAVLKLWEGLGYYSRARNLRKAAAVCVERHGGDLPGNYDELLALPGIGPYTAGAIASLAFGIRVPAVDGNVLRVVTRILADPTDIREGRFVKRITAALGRVMPQDPGAFNEGLMELGELVCIPKGRPSCGECPACGFCLAHEKGTETAFPVKSAPKPRRTEKKTVLVISSGSRFAIRRRPESGLLAGLYELPVLEGHQDRKQIAGLIRQYTEKYECRELPPARHIFSHVEWDMIGYRITAPEPWGEGWFYEDADRILRELSLPTAFRAYAEELKKGMRKRQIEGAVDTDEENVADCQS